MSIFRPVEKLFHQISKLQTLAPLSTVACQSRSPSRKAPRIPEGCLTTPNRPTLKLRRSAVSRAGRPWTASRRPGTASRRPGTAARRHHGLGVEVDDCFGAVPVRRDAEALVLDTVAQTYLGACSSKAPLTCIATPLLGRMPSTSTSLGPQNPPVRHYSMEKEFKVLVRRNIKPCFAPKKLKEKPQPIDWTSPCACDYSKTINRCEHAKCASNVVQCRKPNVKPPYRCPRKRKVVRMKKRKPGRKMLLGYKLCLRPKLTKMFECYPKPPPVIPELPTPKRCPCFTPQEYDYGSPCKKVKGAREPADCRKRRQPPVCVICPPRK